MSEDPKQEQAPGGEQTGTPKSSDVVNELRQLGQQVETLISAALNSEQARTFQQDVVRGVREIGTQVQSAVKTLQENPKVQEFEERGKKAIAEARESQVVDKLQDTLVKGLNYLNEQMTSLAERLRSEQGPPPPPPAASQSVPVEDESIPPTTGDTTRL